MRRGEACSGMPAAPMVAATAAASTRAASSAGSISEPVAGRAPGRPLRARRRRRRCSAGHCRQASSSLARFGGHRLAGERRVERHGEIARGARGARSEAEQIETVHRDERLLRGRGRRGEGRMREHGLRRRAGRWALHRQHDVGPRRDDRLVADRLVAFVLGDGVGGAGQLDDAVGRGRASRHHRATVHEREHEQRLARLCDACAQLARARRDRPRPAWPGIRRARPRRSPARSSGSSRRCPRR